MRSSARSCFQRTPTDQVHVFEQDLDLAPDQEGLEGRVVHVHVGDVYLFDGFFMGLDFGEGGLHVGELALDREGEGGDGALHALEHVDAQEVDQAFLAVHLAEETLAATDAGAVFLVVSFLLVGQDVAERGVGAEIEAADFGIDLPDGTELARAVNVGLDVDGLEALGELAGFGGPVVFFDVLAGAGDGQEIQQREVIETEHVHEPGRFAVGLLQCQPAVELKLGLPDGGFDAGDAVFNEGRVVTLGDEGDLVLEIGESVVDWGGREHEDPRFDAFLDDAPHEAIVAGFVLFVGRLVAEIVGLVNDNQVVIAPVNVRQVNVAGLATVAGQVGVVEHVVMETVGGEDVAAVVGLVDGPIVAKALGDQHQDAVVAQLVILDDGEGLEGFPQADAVGDDAAAQAFQFVEGAHHAVALEPEEFFPDGGIADAGAGFDDAVLVQFRAQVFEDVEENQVVDEGWLLVGHEIGEPGKERVLGLGRILAGFPKGREPGAEHGPFLRRLGTLDQAELVAWGQAQAVRGEGAIAGDDAVAGGVCVLGDESGLGDHAWGGADAGFGGDPFEALPGEPAGLEFVALGTVRGRP